MRFIFLSPLLLPSPWTIPQPPLWLCWESSPCPDWVSANQQTRKTQQGSLGEFLSSGRTRRFKKMWEQICLFLLHLYRGVLCILIPGCCISGGSGNTCSIRGKGGCLLSVCSLPCHFSCLSAHVNAVNKFIEKLIL